MIAVILEALKYGGLVAATITSCCALVLWFGWVGMSIQHFLIANWGDDHTGIEVTGALMAAAPLATALWCLNAGLWRLYW